MGTKLIVPINNIAKKIKIKVNEEAEEILYTEIDAYALHDTPLFRLHLHVRVC